MDYIYATKLGNMSKFSSTPWLKNFLERANKQNYAVTQFVITLLLEKIEKESGYETQ